MQRPAETSTTLAVHIQHGCIGVAIALAADHDLIFLTGEVVGAVGIGDAGERDIIDRFDGIVVLRAEASGGGPGSHADDAHAHLLIADEHGVKINAAFAGQQVLDVGIGGRPTPIWPPAVELRAVVKVAASRATLQREANLPKIPFVDDDLKWNRNDFFALRLDLLAGVNHMFHGSSRLTAETAAGLYRKETTMDDAMLAFA